MASWFQRVFAGPVDEGSAENERKAGLLKVLLVVYFGCVLLLAAVLPLTSRALMAYTANIAIILISWLLLRSGRIKASGAVIIICTFAILAVQVWDDGGVHGVPFVPLFAIVMCAGVMIDWRAAVVTATASIALGSALVAAENAGVLVHPVRLGSLAYLLVYSVALAIATGILTRSLWATDKAMQRLRLSEESLAERNRSLEHHAREHERHEIELNRAIRAYQLLGDCNQALVRATGVAGLIEEICQIIVRDGHYSLAWVGVPNELDPTCLKLAASAGPARGYLSAFDCSGPAVSGDPAQGAWRTCDVTVTNEIPVPGGTDDEWASRAAAHGFKSAIAVPLCVHGQSIGLLGIYSGEAGAFDAEERALLVDLGSDLVYGIEASRHRADAARNAELVRRNEERLRQALLVTRLGVFDHDHVEDVVFWSPELREIYGWPPDEEVPLSGFIGQVLPDDRAAFVAAIEAAHDSSGDGRFETDVRAVRRDGSVVWTTASAQTYFEGEEDARRLVRTVGAVVDITKNKEAEQHIRGNLDRLAALRAIDVAIGGSLNLKLTLGVITEQVLLSLDADAVAVLMLDVHSRALDYAMGGGFRGRGIESRRIALGKGLAGKAAFDQVTLGLRDLSVDLPDEPRAQLFAEEGFATYDVTPLVVKGRTVGVLEVYHREQFAPDEDWIAFLEALALQTAIALDSASMFDNLERSNNEISQAYDDTIEGWSRALDLRDKETEGHTQRVTEMTIRLAEAMGVSAADMVHMRRGALLHDIGKMGVPDSILLKPGELTAEEMAVMRRHPQLAFEMLAPIAHLRPALDIPSCHHEKWDGSGYPRGLKGELIPRAARIFAVVDVWDALSSDRPYRSGWSREEAREYIRANSGTHFDPDVVMHFLELLDQI